MVLLAQQRQLADISGLLQRALDQALRTCPNVESRVNFGRAAQFEQEIWNKVLGEDRNVPALQHLTEDLRQKLLARRGVLPGEPGGDDHGEEDRRGEVHRGGDAGAGTTRERSRTPRPKRSQAPHLCEVAGALPPCLRPWWERPLATLNSLRVDGDELPSGSGGPDSFW